MLGKNILSPQKQMVIEKSLLWNSIVEIFKQEKQIDISQQMVSIRKQNNSYKITVNNPMLKQELLYLIDHIQIKYQEKLNKVGIEHQNIDLFIK